ncbi:MAG: hypothetical protein E6G35_03325 [Actinobacteria bacterium]|nr:MAG: hypothetical protein E6G35_03325 [Actinomycetota bacterium]
MNKWLRRAVGTVGIAGGIWLLGSGTAHADNATPANDPQRLSGLLDSLFTPAGGPTNLGLTLDTPTTRVQTGALPGGPLSFSPGHGRAGVTVHTPLGRHREMAVGGLLDALPISDVLPPRDLGGMTAAPADQQESTRTEGLADLPLIGGLLPLGDLQSGGLPLVSTLTRALPLDATSLPLVGTRCRSSTA